MLSIGTHAAIRGNAIGRALLDIRDALHLYRWDGDQSKTPPLRKRTSILSAARSANITTVVETGTFLGDTSYFLSRRGLDVYTIELEPRLAQIAKKRFSKTENVHCFEGDSSSILPSILAKLNVPAVFWIDAHSSAGFTADSDMNHTLSGEIEALTQKAKKGSIVFIDDMSDFGTNPDDPLFRELKPIIGNRQVSLFDGIVRFDLN